MSLSNHLSVSDLRTPAFVVDLKIVRSNAEKMIERVQTWGIQLRPHVKTHKTVELARIQCDPSNRVITVSTMAEALFFANAGFDDITYAFPLGLDKIDDAWTLAKKIRFGVLIDHPDTLNAVEAYPDKANSVLGVWIKIDSGANRSGLQPDDPRIIELARRITESPSLEFRGIITHAGQSYVDTTLPDLNRTASHEANTLRFVAEKLELNGIRCPGLSLGSTPVASRSSEPSVYEKITEMRPGNYLFYDRYMAESGHCSIDDVACCVASRIVGMYPDRELLIIDAGALAMSKDMGPKHLPLYSKGFGIIRDYPDLHFDRLSQEHGMIHCTTGFERFQIGQVLEIIPNHSCLTAAMFSEYHLIEDDQLIGIIHPVRGW